jgi:hypothetical protein
MRLFFIGMNHVLGTYMVLVCVVWCDRLLGMFLETLVPCIALLLSLNVAFLKLGIEPRFLKT